MIIGKAIIAGSSRKEPFALLCVTYPSGAACVCTDGTTALSAKDTSGYVTFELPNIGTWDVTITQDVHSKSQSFNITQKDSIVEIALDFHTYQVESVGTYYFTKGSVSNPNPSLYDGVYESNNKGKRSTYAVSKITFSGYDVFRVYIRSNADGNYDYTIASTIDAASYPTAYNSATTKASTRGNQQSGKLITNYTLVEYPSDRNEHHIYIVYRKDLSGDENDDKGYFLIEK